MKILTLGDSWTWGENETDNATLPWRQCNSWPAQLAQRYDVEVTNLATAGGSNIRAMRIGIEELCRNSNYDYVILPLAPASRTEILDHGKYHQVWPRDGTQTPIDRVFLDAWHPWNDVQQLILNCFYFIHSAYAMNIPLYIAGLSVDLSQYSKELSWINNYQNDNNFETLGMSLTDFNISITDLDRKLKSLRAIHHKNLQLQPDYFTDILNTYYKNPVTSSKYGYEYKISKSHPNKHGYTALADYFANKIGLTRA